MTAENVKNSWIVGVMGPGNADQDTLETAYKLGAAIAKKGWILLTGGRNQGVMESASRGAAEQNGVVIGISPGESKAGLSQYVSVPILTGMGSGRNYINILSSDIIVACGEGLGTGSEISLALKYQKPVILLRPSEVTATYFNSLSANNIIVKVTLEAAIDEIARIKSESLT